MGAPLLTKTYCPGVLTALMIRLPLFGLVTVCAWEEGLLRFTTLALALAIGGRFHFWEVGRNVFKAW